MSRSLSRIVFDLTTSAHRDGPGGGIVQTERALGRFAREVTGRTVVFTVYDRTRKQLVQLEPEIAASVLDGSVSIGFTTPRPRATSEGVLVRAAWVARHPIRYARHKLPRLHLPSRGEESNRPQRGPPSVPLESAIESAVSLSRTDIVVCCGADSQLVDLAEMYSEKQRRSFFQVAVCYDLIPWKHPHYWPRGVAERVIAHYAEASWLSDLVMCISTSTAKDFEDFCFELDVPCPELGVFRLGDGGSDPEGRRRAVDDLPPLPEGLEASKFVLMVGSIEPRKNHRLVYEVWDDLARDASFPEDVKLVFVGAHQWMTDDLMLEIALNPRVNRRIVVLPKLDDAGLEALYGHCLFSLVPSFDEGWGLPVVESLRHGKICLASRRGALAEVSKLAVLLDPRDFYAWRDAITRYVTDRGERARHEERIRREYEPWSWLDAAESFFEQIDRAQARRDASTAAGHTSH